MVEDNILNFKLLEVKSNSKARFLYYIQEKCLFKKNGKSRRDCESAQYYICAEKSFSGKICKASGKLINNSFIRIETNDHTHDENHEDRAAALVTISSMRENVVNSTDAIETIFSNNVHGQKSPILKLLNHRKIIPNLKRTRRKIVPICQSPKDLHNLLKNSKSIGNKFSSFRDKPFYRGLVNFVNDNASIFLVEQFKEKISLSTVKLFIDGTFNVHPTYFKQLLIIFTEIETIAYPFAFVLMTSRKNGLYKKIFEYLKDVMGIIPLSIMCDYENSMRKALRDTWNETEILGCWFHFSQCVKRKKASKPKLAKLIKSNKKAKLIYRMIQYLPLLPPEKVSKTFEEIIEMQRHFNFFMRFKSLNKYIIKQWILRSDFTNFNVYKLIHRTNNIVEGFNSKLKRAIPRRPSTFIFLSRLHKLMDEIYAKFLNNQKDKVVFKSKSKLNKKLYS
ncbi:hypothetical protein PVAND_017707 [Polypedilum vanderplanki]|uniref:MULE transposase domain-containing protein n=1 Tax=Polypedilum vanderplanki TaxID=319348 RepID=A0A9J6B8G9_POLVA|nr:hypothetical protein PVAND_017707 [Polypedilum vanderplanki]